MSSVFDVPEVLALAISLVLAPTGDGAFKDPARGSIEPAVALEALAALPGTHTPDRSQFQFNEQSWLRAVRAARRLPRFRTFATRIFRTRSGIYYVPIASERRAIFALRRNVAAAFLVTTNELGGLYSALGRKLGRRPAAVELLFARRFGLDAATQFARLNSQNPRAKAASHFPKLAFDNTRLFFGGRAARTAAEIYRIARRSFDRSAKRVLKLARRGGSLQQTSARWKTELAAVDSVSGMKKPTVNRNSSRLMAIAHAQAHLVAANSWGASVHPIQ